MTIKLTQNQLDVIEAAKRTEVQNTLKNGKHKYVKGTERDVQRVLAKFYINNWFGSEVLLTDIVAVFEGREDVEIVEEEQ